MVLGGERGIIFMILMVSGRTDIVAFYSKWFMNRYREGFVDVRNPFYESHVSRIYFSDVDAIMFCTKNPIPMVGYLKEIDKPILFHVTLTSYRKDIEPNVFSKPKIIKSIWEISSILGSDHVVVRYDPVFLSDTYSVEYHIKAIRRLCTLLKGAVKTIIISFIDDYKNVRKNYQSLGIKPFTESDYQKMGQEFSQIAHENGMRIQTCFEERNLVEYGFDRGECLSHELAYRLTGKANFKSQKVRKGKRCQCVEMVDIGVYNSCRHFCKYCYANYDERKVEVNYKNHDPLSSLLIGYLREDDIIKVRRR